MKRGATFLISAILLISFLTFTLAQDAPSVPGGISEEEYNKINDLSSEAGKVTEGDFSGIKEKTKAEERIDAINEWLQWTDPVFLFVFKIPLRLSWEFAYLFFITLFCLSAFHNLPNVFMDNEIVNWVVGFGATFIMGFMGVFKIIVDWIVLVTNKWWWDLVVLGVIIIGIVVMGWVTVWQHKRKVKKGEEQTIESGKRAKEGAEHIEDLGDALDEGFTEGAGI